MRAFFVNVLRRNAKGGDQRADFLRNNRLFESLSLRECQQLGARLHERVYTPEEVVFKEGETAAAMYLIKTGRVSITREGRELITLGEGDFFGESALFTHKARSATITAVEGNTRLLVFSRGELEELIASQPVLANKVILRIAEVLAMRLDLMNESLVRGDADDDDNSAKER